LLGAETEILESKCHFTAVKKDLESQEAICKLPSRTKRN